MFRYKLHSPDGDDLGEATYAMMIKPGEEIVAGKTSTSASSTWSRSRRTTSRRSSDCYRSRPRSQTHDDASVKVFCSVRWGKTGRMLGYALPARAREPLY